MNCFYKHSNRFYKRLAEQNRTLKTGRKTVFERFLPEQLYLYFVSKASHDIFNNSLAAG
jgi:hypothetical protein